MSAPARNPFTELRFWLAIAALAAGVTGLVLLFFIEIPSRNREPLMLALGLVLGWGSTVIGYEFGSSPAGRRAAEAGTRAPDNVSRGTEGGET